MVLIGWLRTTWAAADGEAAGRHRVGEVAGRHRAVELAGLAGLADDDEGLAVELRGDRSGLALALEVAGFELGALGFEPLGVVLGGAERLALRQKEVAGIAVADADDVAHLAEAGDAFEQNDLHGILLCFVQVNGGAPRSLRARR